MKIGNIVWIKQTKRGVYMKKESENTEYKPALPDISVRYLPGVCLPSRFSNSIFSRSGSPLLAGRLKIAAIDNGDLRGRPATKSVKRGFQWNSPHPTFSSERIFVVPVL